MSPLSPVAEPLFPFGGAFFSLRDSAAAFDEVKRKEGKKSASSQEKAGTRPRTPNGPRHRLAGLIATCGRVRLPVAVLMTNRRRQSSRLIVAGGDRL